MVSFLILALTSIDFFSDCPEFMPNFGCVLDEHYFCMEHLRFFNCLLTYKILFCLPLSLTTNLMYIISGPLSVSFCKDGLTSKALREKKIHGDCI